MPIMQMPLLAQDAVEPMQVDEDNDNNVERQVVVENPTLDLEVYANSYTGLARLDRLIHVAEVCPSLRLEALKMAINYVLSTYNVTMYQVLHKKLNDYHLSSQAGGSNGNNGNAGGPAWLPDVAAQSSAAQAQGLDLPSFDPGWVEAKSKKAALKLEKLDSDLKNYKSNSIKESIRRGHDDLGDHYLSCGDLSNALKCYSRARDYCTSGKHVVNMCLNVIKVSLYLQNWSHVLSYVNKAESTPDFAEESKDTNQAIVTRLRCVAGLAELQMDKYKSAAKNFLQAVFDHCDFPEMLSPNNIAVYGGLCALATFDRQELHKHVIASSTFKLFLELEPQLRDVILKFYESKYACCLKLLDEMRDNLMLDMYIAPHFEILYLKIRNRALIQYFSPYVSADLRKMAAAFNRTVQCLENEIMTLILEGQIQARIDSHTKILYAKEANQRNATYERALAMGSEYQRRARMLILRSAMIRNQIHVKMKMGDYYKVLGVSCFASLEEIRKAYRMLVLRWHPDKNPSDMDAAKQRFQAISEAYDVLSDTKKRLEYNKSYRLPGSSVTPNTSAPRMSYDNLNIFEQFISSATEEDFHELFGIPFTETFADVPRASTSEGSRRHDKDHPKPLSDHFLYQDGSLDSMDSLFVGCDSFATLPKDSKELRGVEDN